MLSIVIPVHNEELVLESVVSGITTGLEDFSGGYELILSENGSTDETLALAHQLEAAYPGIVVITSEVASYGRAIKAGILHSKGDSIVVFNADLWDLDFLHTALSLLDQHDIVIASKRHQESHDRRPFNRRLITFTFNLLLRVAFGFKGSDTHGMKAFRTRPIVPVVKHCITEREIFDTEVILRAQRAGLTTIEVPVDVEETRPSRYSPFIRIPRTLRDLAILYRDLYLTPQPKLAELPAEPDKV